MNREIKFRGKLVNSKEWAEGNLCIRIDDTYIITPDETILGKYGRVFKNTIGQYTGLHDKNGKEIYEGDVVKYRDSTGQHIEKVIFDKGCFYAGMHGGSSTRVAPKLINTRITEVIGNVWEDSDLLNDSENTKSN